MKKRIKIVATTLALALFSFNSVNAQDVKSQTEIIKTLKKGKYKIKASSYSYSGEMEIMNVEADKSKPSGNFEVYLEMFPDDESGEGKTRYYYRDNLAFPATYVWNSYAGMSKVRRRAGYVLNTSRNTGEERLIVLDKYIFVIQDWKNKDEYYGITVLDRVAAPEKKKKKKKKGGFGGFFKALKEGVKTASSGGGGKDIIEKLKKEVLQPYLDKAFAKQEQEKKKAKNIALQKQEDELRKKVKKADRDYVKFYNDSLSNTPEYKRIDAHRAKLKAGSVTVYNKSGRTLWVGHDPTSFISHEVRDGSSYQLQHCYNPVYYYYSEGTGKTGTKVCNANAHCGGSVTIN